MADSIFPDPQKQAAPAQKRAAPDLYLRFTGKLKTVSDLQQPAIVSILGANLFGDAPSASGFGGQPRVCGQFARGVVS